MKSVKSKIEHERLKFYLRRASSLVVTLAAFFVCSILMKYEALRQGFDFYIGGVALIPIALSFIAGCLVTLIKW
jgi:uncharacterized membrane protein YccC